MCNIYPNIPIFPGVEKVALEVTNNEVKIPEKLEEMKFAEIDAKLQEEKNKYKIKSLKWIEKVKGTSCAHFQSVPPHAEATEQLMHV